MALLNRDLGGPETVFLAAAGAHARVFIPGIYDVYQMIRNISAVDRIFVYIFPRTDIHTPIHLTCYSDRKSVV